MEGYLNFKFCCLSVFNFVPLYLFVFGFDPFNIARDDLSVHISVFSQANTCNVTRC